MKLIALWIVATVIVIAFACILAYQGKDGWGWFLFVAVLMGSGISVKEKSGKKDGDKETTVK